MEIRPLQGNANTGILGGTRNTSATGSTSVGNNEDNPLMGIGKSDFMKLLVAQLRNQDPLKPMEDKEFIAQMAQLNTVEQISAMNNKLDEFLRVEAMAQASSLIGKTIRAEPTGANPIAGVVQEVRIEQNKPMLIVNGNEVNLADVRSIDAAG
ncbi:MAG: hypothetical protein M1343_02900 [Chloroflexi bacterium]|nr:hypothetical protein [Chloroflexota bacterium]